MGFLARVMWHGEGKEKLVHGERRISGIYQEKNQQKKTIGWVRNLGDKSENTQEHAHKVRMLHRLTFSSIKK